MEDFVIAYNIYHFIKISLINIVLYLYNMVLYLYNMVLYLYNNRYRALYKALVKLYIIKLCIKL
jgi:hypothetical protein